MKKEKIEAFEKLYKKLMFAVGTVEIKGQTFYKCNKNIVLTLLKDLSNGDYLDFCKFMLKQKEKIIDKIKFYQIEGDDANVKAMRSELAKFNTLYLEIESNIDKVISKVKPSTKLLKRK